MPLYFQRRIGWDEDGVDCAREARSLGHMDATPAAFQNEYATTHSNPEAFMRTVPIASPLLLLLACALAAPAASAADVSVKTRLDARGVKYQVDGDGDYKVTYSYKQEDRTQLVFVSGATESVGGFTVREVFAPAGLVDKDTIDGAKALELLAESRTNKLGSWELAGNTLYFVIKLPDSVDAAQLEAAMDIAAETADNMEIELSGDRDDL